MGARKVALEVEDVPDVGAAPAIDGLVVVAHHRHVPGANRPAAARTGTARGWCPGTRRRGRSGSGRDSGAAARRWPRAARPGG